MRTILALVFALTALIPLAPAIAQQDDGGTLRWFVPDRREAQRELESTMLDTIDPAQLRAWHELACARPHPAGSPGDRALIQALATELTRMGLDVEVQWFHAMLASPVAAELNLLTGRDAIELGVRESPVVGDEWSADPELSVGFNAYSASGEITAEYVYANYGTWQDFERLEELGVDVTGKIVIARYGRNYRGFKAFFAEQAGAAGLVMFTDPADSGHLRGPVYPEGGYANGESIQRGSVLVAPYPGDPLTPGVFAGEDVERVALEDAPLPKILVQPIGYDAATQILGAMTGPEAPEEWQGGIDTTYRLTSGFPQLRIRIEQKREIVRTANVIATLLGTSEPHLEVIAGCHHDAWTHGAGDPGAGTMVLLELARVFAARAREGDRPERTLRFAFWGAEEHGIVGSTEYVESRERELGLGCVAYMNLDMAAMGPRFRASASPSLQGILHSATADLTTFGDDSATLFDEWRGASETPHIGTMGGGSDHVAFLCRTGVPCVALAMGGSRGVAYHSAHDTLAWYRQVVGDDYESARKVTEVAAVMLSRMVNADVLPLTPWRYGDAAARAHEDMQEGIDAVNPRACTRLHVAWHTLNSAEERFIGARRRVVDDGEDPAVLNGALMRCDRAWVESEGRGLPGRDWYRNHFAAPDERSGYSAWVLPGMRAAIAREDADMLLEMARRVERAARRAEAAAVSVDQPSVIGR